MLVNKKESQLDRFKEAAREVGVDESDNALYKVMRKLDLTRKPVADEPTPPAKERRSSDKRR